MSTSPQGAADDKPGELTHRDYAEALEITRRVSMKIGRSKVLRGRNSGVRCAFLHSGLRTPLQLRSGLIEVAPIDNSSHDLRAAKVFNANPKGRRHRLTSDVSACHYWMAIFPFL
jgi:hypothetical protein